MSNCGACGQNTSCACFFGDSCQPSGELYVDLPGTAGNFISTPDSAALSITGDIDVRVKLRMDNWGSASFEGFIQKDGGGSQRSWAFYKTTGTNWQSFWTSDGSTVITTTGGPGAFVGVRWVRWTLDVDNGVGGAVSTLYSSTDGNTWIQATSVIHPGPSSIFDSNATIKIGDISLAGNVYYAEVRNGIDGPIVGVFDPDDAVPVPTSGTQVPSTVTSSYTGEIWTLNGAGWVWGQDSDESCVTVLGSGFGMNHSTISPDFDPLFPGPFKFKSTNTPDPYPMGYIFKTTTQVIPALTHQVIEFDSGAGWPGDMENFAANPYALTVVEDGIYLVGLNLSTLDSAGAEDQIVYIRRNGTIEDIAADKIGTAINGAEQRGQSVMALISLVAGDYLEGVIFSGTAKTISITVAAGTVSSTPHLWARWMGAL